MRILVAGINYRPEPSSVGPYTAGLAEHLVARGDQVTVITGLPHYPEWRVAPGARRRLWSRETIDGVDVVRSAHFVPARPSAVGRATYEATYTLTAMLAAGAVARPDVVLGVVPSLGGGIVARVAARRFGVPYGVLLQDLIGKLARGSGMQVGALIAGATSRGETWALRQATAVGIVAGAFRPYLLDLGVAEEAIHHVPNWSRITPPAMTVAETRARFGWDDGRQVVLHAGNMGFKQGLEQVVEAARIALEHGDPIRFVLSGGGNQAEAIGALARDLPNIDMLGVQPDGTHASLMAAADVLLLSERASQVDMSLPSKLTSYFASGRPIVAAVPAGGASAGEVGRSGAGVVVPAGMPDAMLSALRGLREDPRRAETLAAAGPRYARSTTSAAVCLAAAERFVDAIAGRAAAAGELAA